MPIDCTHWRAGESRDGGRCTLGLYGGRPSYGVCLRACGVRVGRPERELWGRPWRSGFEHEPAGYAWDEDYGTPGIRGGCGCA